jgi:hypothetical protein
MKPILGMAATVLLAAFSAPAQDAAADKKLAERMSRELGTAKILQLEGGIMTAPVKGAPYSATEVTESTQVLADGTRIHNEQQTTVYRDGMGRVRRESGDEVVLMDPVAGVRYGINVSSRSVNKMSMTGIYRVGGQSGPNFVYMAAGKEPPPDAGPPHMMIMESNIQRVMPDIPVAIGYKVQLGGGKTEDLGAKNMEGVLVQGTHTTRTIETGAIGNDRPINVVSERWFSPDLQSVVMTNQSDPRQGETIFKLIDIRRGEPDPSLFQVPAGYQVTERKE